MTRVVVHIDRLVLKGARPEDRHAIAQGLQDELSRVFGERDAVARLRSLGDVPQIKVGGVAVERGGLPQRLGQSVAQGIGRGISR
jgi:hypothetical protein